jgi:hypothetical protein
MGRTFIFTTNDKYEADKKADYWIGAGLSVTGIGPTDIIEISGEAAPKVSWDSGDVSDWYIVIGTRDKRGEWIDKK